MILQAPTKNLESGIKLSSSVLFFSIAVFFVAQWYFHSLTPSIQGARLLEKISLALAVLYLSSSLALIAQFTVKKLRYQQSLSSYDRICAVAALIAFVLLLLQ